MTNENEQAQQVAFIGTGVMGRSMALNLIRRRIPAHHVHTARATKASDVFDAGAALGARPWPKPCATPTSS